MLQHLAPLLAWAWLNICGMADTIDRQGNLVGFVFRYGRAARGMVCNAAGGVGRWSHRDVAQRKHFFRADRDFGNGPRLGRALSSAVQAPPLRLLPQLN